MFFIFVFPLLCSASHSPPPPPRVSLHPSQCQPPLPLFSKRCGQSQEARRAPNPGAALTPLGRVAALICANLRHSLWHILTQICTSWDCKHAQARAKNKDTGRPRIYGTQIERANKWVQTYIRPVPTGEIANVRAISVQTNAAESDLPVAKMHSDNSCLSLQQQTAICNAPSITKPGSISKLCVFPFQVFVQNSVSFKDGRQAERTHRHSRLLHYNVL